MHRSYRFQCSMSSLIQQMLPSKDGNLFSPASTYDKYPLQKILSSIATKFTSFSRTAGLWRKEVNSKLISKVVFGNNRPFLEILDESEGALYRQFLKGIFKIDQNRFTSLVSAIVAHQRNVNIYVVIVAERQWNALVGLAMISSLMVLRA